MSEPKRTPVTFAQFGVECPVCTCQLAIIPDDDWHEADDGLWEPSDPADQFMRCDVEDCPGFVELPRIRLELSYPADGPLEGQDETAGKG